jgi:hypothetical protein
MSFTSLSARCRHDLRFPSFSAWTLQFREPPKQKPDEYLVSGNRQKRRERRDTGFSTVFGRLSEGPLSESCRPRAARYLAAPQPQSATRSHWRRFATAPSMFGQLKIPPSTTTNGLAASSPGYISLPPDPGSNLSTPHKLIASTASRANSLGSSVGRFRYGRPRAAMMLLDSRPTGLTLPLMHLACNLAHVEHAASQGHSCAPQE